ncbi:FkbM family methyltransferase [Roseofilum sp. BLCC_M91]|uniref:FkbM family methyltransferase n=1 Tax=Roseofilum halophilum BLCC-M91 TaxID=3022259 RepID=A0ABT7BN21_9CYAN|nr:FkbM family methyltransferase [Roseofilum halophilum]MDJ1180587.1 FkbM family methyltransferase [Roseofilum halophilum BLCC-M91]
MKKQIKQAFRNLGWELEFHKFSPDISEVARLKRLLDYHQIDLIFDVGANKGQYARYLREIGYGGKIVSFEPLSQCHDQLQALSQSDPLWEIAPQGALGDRNGEIEINVSANTLSSSVLGMLDDHVEAAPESAYINQEKVALRTLDSLAANYLTQEIQAPFLKLDVQGFEMQVLAGATENLSKIKAIQLELSLVPLYEGQILLRETLDKLEEMGYELHQISPDFTDLKTGRMLQVDGIFIKK